jgi:hypothetical protein
VGLGFGLLGWGFTRCTSPANTPARCRRFPGRVLLTERHCGSERCDFRDCEGMRYSLIDMMNLARTRLILGSGTAATPQPYPLVGPVLPRSATTSRYSATRSRQLIP